MSTFILNLTIADGNTVNAAQFMSLLQNLTPSAGFISDRPLLGAAADEDCLLVLDTSAGAVSKITRASLIPQAVDSALSLKETVNQVDHGFAVGDVLRKTSETGKYAKAKADTVENASGIAGVVESVANSNSFVLLHAGIVSGLSGLTEGALYRLSAEAAGAVTVTPQAIDKPVYLALSASKALVLPGGVSIKEYSENQYAPALSAEENAYTATLVPAPAAYLTGMQVALKVAAGNTGATTLDLNELGEKDVQVNGAALAGGEIVAGQVLQLRYDGTAFQLLNPQVIPSPQVPVRQTVLSGPLDANGLPNFLPATSSGLSLTTQNITTDIPLIVAAAMGFGLAGAMDRIGRATSNLTWTGLTPNATNYLYVDVAVTGELTPGSSPLTPYYGKSANDFSWSADLTSTATAIADSENTAKTNAFDNNTGTGWSTVQTGAASFGVAYIGQNFSAPKQIRRIRLMQGFIGGSIIHLTSSVKVQYSDNGSIWNDAATLALVRDDTIWQNFELPDNGSHAYWRLLENNNTANQRFCVKEIEMFEKAGDGVFFFNTASMNGGIYTGAETTPVIRVFVGEAVTGSGSVSATLTYAYQGEFVSPWTSPLPSGATKTSVSHNLGVTPRHFRLVAECVTAEQGYAIGEQVSSDRGLGGYWNSHYFMPIASGVSAKTAWFTAPDTGLGTGIASSNQLTPLTAVNWKYSLEVKRGW